MSAWSKQWTELQWASSPAMQRRLAAQGFVVVANQRPTHHSHYSVLMERQITPPIAGKGEG